MNSLGRNEPNKNIEKAFSGDSLYHHEKITETMDIGKADYDINNNKNKNNIIPANQHPSIGHKLKNSFSGSGNARTTSPQKKEQLIRISEYKIEQPANQDKNNKNRINNNKDLINRLKKQSSYLKSSITNKNQINNSKNKVVTCFQFEEKENLSMNKHIKNEKSHCHLVKGIDILSKYDTFEIDQKKNIYVDKNKFNKNSHIFNEKNKDYDMLKKIKNLKTFHPKLNNKKTMSIHLNKDNLNLEKEKEKETNTNIITNTINTQNNIDSNNNNNGSYLIDKDKDKNKLRNISRSNLIKKSKDKIRSKDKQNCKVNDKDSNEQNNQKEIIKEEEINKNNNEIENENDKNKVDINANHENKENIENIEKEKDTQEKVNEKNEEIGQVNNHENKKKIKEKEKEEIEIKNEKNNVKENQKKIKNSNNNNNNKDEKDFYFILYEGEKKQDEEEKVLYFDTSNINNIQIPKEYLNTIYYNLLKEEMAELNPKPVHTYMKTQKEINEQMRSILVDWIIDVHHKFGFTDETLFMTILIIDRYCTIENITRIKYQCLGITALMIACKHEEINVPKVEDFIYITDNAYTKEEVFQMENDVLDKLNFCLLYPSPIKFYEYLSLHFNFSKKYYMLGKYLMESFLLDLKYIKYKSSVISCACAYIVMKFFKMANYRHSYDKKFYLVDENINTIPNGLGVKDCAQDICVFVDNINNTNLLSCQKKYTKTEFESVATLISNNK